MFISAIARETNLQKQKRFAHICLHSSHWNICAKTSRELLFFNTSLVRVLSFSGSDSKLWWYIRERERQKYFWLVELYQPGASILVLSFLPLSHIVHGRWDEKKTMNVEKYISGQHLQMVISIRKLPPWMKLECRLSISFYARDSFSGKLEGTALSLIGYNLDKEPPPPPTPNTNTHTHTHTHTHACAQTVIMYY